MDQSTFSFVSSNANAGDVDFMKTWIATIVNAVQPETLASRLRASVLTEEEWVVGAGVVLRRKGDGRETGKGKRH